MPIDFALTEENRLVQSTVRGFAGKEIEPHIREWDSKHELHPEVFARMGELGFLGAPIPEEYGGNGLDYVSLGILCEELERADTAFRVVMSVHVGLNSLTLLQWGSEDQKQRYLVPQARGEKLATFGLTEPGVGTDAANLSTTARRDGDAYVLNGQKIWISLADIADHFLVFATVDRAQKHRGITAFVVERGMDGLSTRTIDGKLGIWAGNTGEIYFDNVRVPVENRVGEEGEGFTIAMSAIDQGRYTVASGAVGLAQACLDASLKYAHERKTFGEEIGQHQLVKEMIANMGAGIEAGRLLCRQAAWLKNRGQRNTRETSLAKWFTTEHAVKAALDAIQIHGAYGYSDEYPLARYLRNSKAAVIYEGTSQLHTLIQADYLLGYREDKPLRCPPASGGGFRERLIQPVDPEGWSERQLRGLAALFATIAEPSYDGESLRHARLAAAALSEVAEPSDLRQLKLTIELLEADIGLPRVTAMLAFSRMKQDDRERLLGHWATSRLGQRRTFFQTIKRLAGFFAYADPGPSGMNARWGPMGYSVPDHELPEAIQIGLVDLSPGAEPLSLDAEIVVVGSGAGGGVAAARLAEAGHEVLVVEAGPYVPEAEMPHYELDAFTRLYLDHGMTSSADLGVAILSGAAVGGGTLVNWTTCIDPPDWIRADWARNHGLDGFDGADGDGELARVRVELGFSPPPSIGPKDRAILDGAATLGWEAAETERNADDCTDCGACGFGCRRGAKKSGQRLHLALAARHGARILPNARVDRITFANGRATGVSGALHDGRRLVVNARRVVLAAGALRTPLVLIRSGIDHPAVGNYLRLHPTSAIGARMDNDVSMWRDTMQAARSLELVRDGVIIESAPAHPGLIALAFPWQGAARQAELMRDIRRYAPLIVITSDEDHGRVKLSRSGRARIEYRISKRDSNTARKGLVAAARMARAAGADRLVALGTPAAWLDNPADDQAFESYLDRLGSFDFTPNRGALFSAHQMGSARAGVNPRTSVCDPQGRVRGASGIYVADASLFPTSVGVNPMVTVMAMAALVARTVHSDFAT